MSPAVLLLQGVSICDILVCFRVSAAGGFGLFAVFTKFVQIPFAMSFTRNLISAVVFAGAALQAMAVDHECFQNPPRNHYPETWFHFISRNVSKEGITADLEAIAGAGFSGVQFFHGHFTDDVWPEVTNPIRCLDPNWEDAVHHIAAECHRLGLRFTMQNCPGWAMAGGPWIKPENAMRHVVMSRTDLCGDGSAKSIDLPLPQPSNEAWRDYRDIAVLAFPTPEGGALPSFTITDTNRPDAPWERWLRGEHAGFSFAPGTQRVEIEFDEPVTLRSVRLPGIESFNHGWCYEPGVDLRIDADGKTVLDMAVPQSAWQEEVPSTFALDECKSKKYCIEITNRHDMRLDRLTVSTEARKNNWETEAGRVLRAIERSAALPAQSASAFIDGSRIIDISDRMDASGRLDWTVPKGSWTVLRIGNVNTGRRNGPAPAEGTGWECDKLSTQASKIHFDNYIGRLSGAGGPVGDGLLGGMLMDSWECGTQTWTPDMESAFSSASGYGLRKWLPALFGYVIDAHETTTRFLRDWRRTIDGLIGDRFYANMAALAHERGLTVAYETAIGDVVPGDPLRYFKYADVPMCEFWQPMGDSYVGSINFKPIKPTASAARIYGKPRVAAEAFTSFEHTWDENLAMLKAVADANMAEGVTHLVFHTYTHNPQVGFLPPGTSFGGRGIGSPFLRGQTWWPYMHSFTDYLARCSYMFETGRPVSDVLWYLGDEMDHKPDQNAPFPDGFRYDYCNPDVLINRLTVSDGNIMTPEGISYRMLWIPENRRMLPETVEALHRLAKAGATVVGNAPRGLATLGADEKAFAKAVKKLWNGKTGVRKVGKGRVISGMSLDEAIAVLGIAPDLLAGEAVWSHFRDDAADWYFVASPKGKALSQTLDFGCGGYPQLWNPVDGSMKALAYERRGDRTFVPVELPAGGSCFIMFTDNELPLAPANKAKTAIALDKWTLSFPSGWGIDKALEIAALKPWCELDDLSDEAKAFSGTATYTTTFDIDSTGAGYTLDLGEVAHIAEVSLNGKPLGTLWCKPYSLDIGAHLRKGRNELTVKVTGTWFNRLVYDAALPAAERKTWAIRLPSPAEKLRPSGLLGPVTITGL